MVTDGLRSWLCTLQKTTTNTICTSTRTPVAKRRPNRIQTSASFTMPIRLLQVLLLGLLIKTSWALHFYLDAGTKRCFSDSAMPNTKILIEYTVSTGTGIMPIDVSVSLNEGSKQILSRADVEHGKMAFVLPFPETDEVDHVYHAEAKRKKIKKKRSFEDLHNHHHDHHDQRNLHNQHFHHGRRLLSVKDESIKGDFNDDDDDDDDGDDDFDWDNYSGIDEKDLNADSARNEKKHQQLHEHEDVEDDEDEEEEERVFATRKFELCVSNAVFKNEAKKRRVRLVIRKGNDALDYSKLAKNEHMSHLEVSLGRISNELKALMAELDQAQRMEKILYRLNQGTNNQVVVLGILSLIVLSTVAAYQLIYTKQYFKRKKIL